MKRLVAATLLALVPAAPASAGLIPTYSMTDDVWGTPIGSGRILIDARAQYLTRNPAVLNIPVVSFVFGVTPWLELGANGSYGFSGLFTSGTTSTTGPASGYLKVAAPWHPMGSTLGLVVGGQVPTMANQGYTLAAEAAVSTPVNEAWTVDFNLGAGRNLDAATWLAHGGASVYYLLPNHHTLMLEGFGYYNHLGAGLVMGQRAGYQLPLSSANSLDFSVTAYEKTTGLEFMPMIGATIMM